MPMEVQLIRAREFIRVGPQGKLDLQNSRTILESLTAACRRRGIERAMLDLRDVWSDFGPEELAAILRMFGEIGFPHIKRLALLHSGDPHRRVRVLALLASLRGWSVRAFDNFEAAFEWLALAKGSEKPRPTVVQQDIPIRHRIPSRKVEANTQPTRLERHGNGVKKRS